MSNWFASISISYSFDLSVADRDGLSQLGAGEGSGGAKQDDSKILLWPQSTHVCRVQSSVWRLPKYWPAAPSPPSECVLLPHQRREGTHSPRGEGVRGQYFEDGRHWIGLWQYNPSTAGALFLYFRFMVGPFATPTVNVYSYADKILSANIWFILFGTKLFWSSSIYRFFMSRCLT